MLSLKLLVVEDDPSSLELMSEVLRNSSHSINKDEDLCGSSLLNECPAVRGVDIVSLIRK
jgi:CheY-like chemotaxis protein